jgi:hypothetical protein
MRSLARRLTLAVLVLSLAVTARGVGAGEKSEKPKKPKLTLRAAPRMAASPASVFFTAELQGGDDIEEFHCPALEWDWDDGTKSTHESDCEPFAPGTEIARRFSSQHTFAEQGTYNVKVTLKRADRMIASTRVTVNVRPGFGDMSRRY